MVRYNKGIKRKNWFYRKDELDLEYEVDLRDPRDKTTGLESRKIYDGNTELGKLYRDEIVEILEE